MTSKSGLFSDLSPNLPQALDPQIASQPTSQLAVATLGGNLQAPLPGPLPPHRPWACPSSHLPQCRPLQVAPVLDSASIANRGITQKEPNHSESSLSVHKTTALPNASAARPLASGPTCPSPPVSTRNPCFSTPPLCIGYPLCLGGPSCPACMEQSLPVFKPPSLQDPRSGRPSETLCILWAPLQGSLGLTPALGPLHTVCVLPCRRAPRGGGVSEPALCPQPRPGPARGGRAVTSGPESRLQLEVEVQRGNRGSGGRKNYPPFAIRSLRTWSNLPRAAVSVPIN